MRYYPAFVAGALLVAASLLPSTKAGSSCSTAGVTSSSQPPISCTSYHPELASSQKYCSMANAQGVYSNGISFQSTTLSCPYGINVDYFNLNYYDSTSSDATINVDFSLQRGSSSVSDSVPLSPSSCYDWISDFQNNPSLTQVTWDFNSGGPTHGLMMEFAMYCTQPTTPAPTTQATTAATTAASTSPTTAAAQYVALQGYR